MAMFLESESRRFANLSERELESILSEKQSEKTTNWCVSTFKAWCKEKQIRTPVEDMSLGQLDANLRRFYAEARKMNGEIYSKKTLLGFRHAIERHLNQPPLSRSLKLSTDPRFKRSNEMLDAQLVQMKRNGLENTKHKPAIEDKDLKKLKTSKALSPDTPSSLLRNVWFHVVLHFCRRGREGQRALKKNKLPV
ncbi:predicted protein [Nematostella vectensis]|uniref:Uncharacterized protein n=1 Tax=Nematostella vectensis TaxID=45351 RepID=A7SWJ4_NEMVE|nr:predicted protein [Nematostella vectensis]|eukprot:XP_001624018.1 predicted protein [Nematostella vectensis]